MTTILDVFSFLDVINIQSIDRRVNFSFVYFKMQNGIGASTKCIYTCVEVDAGLSSRNYEITHNGVDRDGN